MNSEKQPLKTAMENFQSKWWHKTLAVIYGTVFGLAIILILFVSYLINREEIETVNLRTELNIFFLTIFSFELLKRIYYSILTKKPYPKKNSSQNWKSALLTLLFFGAAFGTVQGWEFMENQRILHWEKQEAKRLEKEVEKIFLEKGTEIQIPKVDTSDWLTYEDKEKGFSFKYPKDWEVKQLATEKEIERYKDEKDDEERSAYGGSRWENRDIKGQLGGITFLCLNSKSLEEEKKKIGMCSVRFEEVISNWNKRDPWYVWMKYNKEREDGKEFSGMKYIKFNQRLLPISQWNSPLYEYKLQVPYLKFNTFRNRVIEIDRNDTRDLEMQQIYLGIIQTIIMN